MSVGFGAFTKGLAGGMSIGKSFKNGMKSDDATKAAGSPGASDQGETGFGIGKSLVSGDVSSPQYAGGSDGESGGVWGFLSGLLGGQGDSGSSVTGKGLGSSIAGQIINPDDPVAGTIGGAILGKLLK